MFPIAADHGARAGHSTLAEEMAADALHCGGLACSPYAHVGFQRRAGDGGDEGIAGTRTGLELIPLHRRAGMGGQLEAGVEMLHFDENHDLGPRRQCSQQHADGGQRRFVAGQQEAARRRIDLVPAPRSGDSGSMSRSCCTRPCGEGAVPVADDLEIGFMRARLEREQGERADDRAAPVLEEELKLPLQLGITTSAGSADSSNLRLAAGSSSSSPSSAGPVSVTRVIYGLSGSTRATSATRNGGGSRRVRITLTA